MAFLSILLQNNVKATLDDTQKGKCKLCKQPIYWAVTNDVKNLAICKDKKGYWIPHYMACTGTRAYKESHGDPLDDALLQSKREKWFYA